MEGFLSYAQWKKEVQGVLCTLLSFGVNKRENRNIRVCVCINLYVCLFFPSFIGIHLYVCLFFPSFIGIHLYVCLLFPSFIGV